MPHPHIARRRWLATTLASAAMMMSASSAAAASATLDDVLTDLGDWGLVMAEHAGGPADCGARGVVRRGRTRFLACLAISSFENANGDNGFDWSEARLGKLPPPFRRYGAKLGKLAKDHWLVVSHFRDAEKHVDLWNLYVVERTPDRLIAGVLMGRARLPRPAGVAES